MNSLRDTFKIHFYTELLGPTLAVTKSKNKCINSKNWSAHNCARKSQNKNTRELLYRKRYPSFKLKITPVRYYTLSKIQAFLLRHSINFRSSIQTIKYILSSILFFLNSNYLYCTYLHLYAHFHVMKIKDKQNEKSYKNFPF
jgi:hypothetical protein